MLPVMLEPTTTRSRVNHSTTEPRHSFGEGKREKAGCFSFTVFLMSCGCYYLPLPNGAMDWSILCDCGILTCSFLLPLVIKRSEADRVLML